MFVFFLKNIKIDYEEFAKLASICNISKQNIENIIQLFLECGMLIEYNKFLFNQQTNIGEHIENLIEDDLNTRLSNDTPYIDVDQLHSHNVGHNRKFLSAKWLANLLVTLHPSEISNYSLPKGGILKEDSIEQCWHTSLFPISYSSNLFEILNELDYVYYFPNCDKYIQCKYSIGRGCFNSFTNNTVAVIPANLHPARPQSEIDQLLNHTILSNSLLYSFPFLPVSFFSGLIIELFKLLIPTIIWKFGICCHTDGNSDEFILVETIDQHNLSATPNLPLNFTIPPRSCFIRITSFLTVKGLQSGQKLQLPDIVIQALEKISLKWFVNLKCALEILPQQQRKLMTTC